MQVAPYVKVLLSSEIKCNSCLQYASSKVAQSQSMYNLLVPFQCLTIGVQFLLSRCPSNEDYTFALDASY